ncbi:MAG: hypothetical protein IT372_05860 [Polyangiaceae bacterium]|nr:hypothetical protein [Polyangiaceae bacterium]
MFDDSTWERAHGGYIDGLDAVLQLPWATFSDDDGYAAAVHSAHARRLSALARLHDILLEGVLPAPERFAVLAIRCEHLLDLPLAPLAAARDPVRYRAAGLPLDLHPRFTMLERTPIAREPCPWPSPRPSDVCVLIGDDLGEGEMLDSISEIRDADLAAPLRWALDRGRALNLARSRGARVHPLTVDSLLAALEGELGGYIQIIATTSADEADVPLLCAQDGSIDLRALTARIKRAHVDGFRSPLEAVDIASCCSADDLSGVFHAAGVRFVSSFAALIHPGSISGALLKMYEHDLLDGHTPFQHAWIWAHLLDHRK